MYISAMLSSVRIAEFVQAQDFTRKDIKVNINEYGGRKRTRKNCQKEKKNNGREAVHLSDQMDLDNILEIALSCKTACMFWLLE